MDGLTNEELVHRYTEATMRHDHAQLESMRHRDWSVLWPQSREVVRGSENFRAIVEHYPGGQPQLLRERVVGSEDQWAISPLGGAYRVAGAGSNWWAEWRMVYPDGRTYWSIALLELRDGKVFRETTFWAEPFEAPAWRSQWVERLPPDVAPEPTQPRSETDPGPGPLA